MVSNGSSMIIGQPAAEISPPISQPWLDAADESRPHPDERDIAAYLKARGFTALFDALYGWIRESDGIVILDAKPDNFILTERGILPVDLLITEILPVP